MSSRGNMSNPVLRELKKLLDSIGLPWSIEQGGKHKKIIMAGEFIGVVPMGRYSGNRRGAMNIEMMIRRKAKEHGVV